MVVRGALGVGSLGGVSCDCSICVSPHIPSSSVSMLLYQNRNSHAGRAQAGLGPWVWGGHGSAQTQGRL